eukprot:CAMPEP_0115520510 /NCGR_PEP_ID=MMETSP0271-20121206/79028_1 /TAXON_ID=71861 /ORGANISM="Scrippsiella trochoidea, Strain CCMP3099" /LENGTH=44 /DNA_ID= /DNA_START= /DNA_END= /DNA_ORIENTATION=
MSCAFSPLTAPASRNSPDTWPAPPASNFASHAAPEDPGERRLQR